METFDIRQHVEFDAKGRALCPVCALTKGPSYQRKALSVLENGAYKCFRGCSPQEIREALGVRDRQLPAAIACNAIPKKAGVPPQKVREAHTTLMESDGPAKQWLIRRGIHEEMIQFYRLGIVKVRQGNKNCPAISIPIPAKDDGTEFYLKKRVAPWLPEGERPAEYQPWSQYGVPARVWFSYRPENAVETWLCEGEWDAMMLGWVLHSTGEAIAVACFTSGAGNVPPEDQLDLLPGKVAIWYDRDEPGQKGAQKIAAALGARAAIATVPAPVKEPPQGWDISDALNVGTALEDLKAAAAIAIPGTETPKNGDNPLRARLVSNDELMARAADYVEWLVPDLLTANELFALAGPPRAGKSLLVLELARCIASGEKFLDRPVTQGPVLFVRCEDSESKTKERELAQGWSEGLPVFWLDKFKLSDLRHLKELVTELQCRLIILDTLSRIRTADISESAAEMSLVLEPLQDMAEELGVCVLLVHHTGKVKLDQEGGFLEVFDSIRGSSAIRGTCRGTLVIASDDRTGYRLCSENGHTKESLLIELDTNTLKWRLKGKWNPIAINADQKQLVLDFLTKVGEATIETISTETGIPKRSLYVVLTRLCADETVKKIGNRRQSIYRKEAIQQIQLLENLLNSSNPGQETDVDVIQQKNNFSLSDNTFPLTSSSLSTSEPNCDVTNQCNVRNSGGSLSVEYSYIGDSNPEPVIDAAIQQESNRNSTVELKEGGDCVFLHQGKWKRAKYLRPDGRSMISHSKPGLHDSHWIRYRKTDLRVAQPDLRRDNAQA